MGQPEGEDGGITFGSELRRRRTAEGLSLTALAKRLKTSNGYLSRLENDLQRPSVPFARAVDDELKEGDALLAFGRGAGREVCPYQGLTPFIERDAGCFCGQVYALSPFREPWFWITFSAGATEGHHKRDHERPHAERRTRLRSRSKLARPNICRFSILILLLWPSTAPEL
ncbi:helix-turn-helix domain-containing protein [Streptomyces sp. NPDC002156]